MDGPRGNQCVGRNIRKNAGRCLNDDSGPDGDAFTDQGPGPNPNIIANWSPGGCPMNREPTANVVVFAHSNARVIKTWQRSQRASGPSADAAAKQPSKKVRRKIQLLRPFQNEMSPSSNPERCSAIKMPELSEDYLLRAKLRVPNFQTFEN